jgi:acyl-CoA hydrolase
MPFPENWYHLAAEFADIGTAETLTFVVPTAGYLRKVMTVLDGAITASNETVTVAVDGTTLSPTITITQSSSAAGDVDFAEFFYPVKAGSRVTVATAGNSTGATGCAVTVTFSG